MYGISRMFEYTWARSDLLELELILSLRWRSNGELTSGVFLGITGEI